MIENVMDRLEGINKDRLNESLVSLVVTAEDLGYKCKDFLNAAGTRDDLISAQEKWQDAIDKFYEEFVR